MFSLTASLRKARNWWFHLCTGQSDYDSADEEHHRQRILVMSGAFWLINVLLFTLIVPFFTPLSSKGSVAAQFLFGATVFGVLVSMLILRLKQDRIIAVNVMLLIYGGSFAASCFFLGGTTSPTFPLMILIPVMASIVGSASLCVAWSLLVLAFWLGLFQAERGGMEVLQIILPQNYSLAMLLTYTAMAASVVSIVLIYAEMNKVLRQSLQESNEELEHLSSHDQLTRLPNRRFYDERIALALHRAAEHGSLTGVLILDLDGFKQINDTYGHGAGDKLLQAVAHRIQVNLRETDLVARLGGDEFVAVIEDAKSPDEITRIAHKLSHAVEQPLYVRQQLLKFSASIGVAIFPIDGRQQQELEEKADKAMYLAKKRGVPVALASLESDNVPTPVRARVNRR
jgi:diguanylate cyclase (GGDEF)-like protein